MLSTSLPLPLLLLLLSASCFGQNVPVPPQLPQPEPTFRDTCSIKATTITCKCRADLQELKLTPAFMEGDGEAEELMISGCSSVTFAFPPLRSLLTLSVMHTASATFQEKASPQLRHLTLMNVSQVAFHGPIFQGAHIETLLLDDVRIGTLPLGAFANLNMIQNVTLKNVYFNKIDEGAIEFQMVSNSQLIIINSQLLGVQKSGIVVKGVAHFTMHNSNLTTVGDYGLQLDARGPVSISNSQLQPGGKLRLNMLSGTAFNFMSNVWRGSSVFDLAQQLVLSQVILKVSGNTFSCDCSPEVDILNNLPEAKSLLESNQCDKGLCERPVPMNILTKCRDEAALQAACMNAPPIPATDSVVPTPSGVTQAPMAAKPLIPGTKNIAATIAISVTTAFLLTLPAATALVL